MTTTFEPGLRSEALASYYETDPIELLDDLVQIFTDNGHEDLGKKIHDVLLELDAREHPAGPEYNGWKNYGTWNVALWLGNEETSCQAMSDYARGTEDPTYRGFIEYAGFEGCTPDRIRWIHATHDYDALDEFIAEYAG